MTVPIYPPWWAGTIGLATGEKGDSSDPDTQENFTQKTLTVAAENSPVPWCSGTVKIGGMVFAAGMNGSRLVLGYAFCLGEADLVNMEMNNADHALGVTKNGINFKAWYRGENTQTADPTLGLIGATDTLTGTHDGEDYGVAYAVLEIEWTTPIPQPVATVTRGSDNPALALKEFIESRITGYGKTVDATAAEAYCDELVGGKPRYRANILFESQGSVPSRIEEMRAYAGCDVNMSGDVVVLVPRKQGPAVRTLSSTDMIEGSVGFTQPATSDIPNHVEVDWTFEDRGIITSAEWDDLSGERRTQSINLPFINDAGQALREAENRLNYYRYNILTCTFETFDEGLTTMVGDIVEIDYPLLVIPALMRVVSIDSRSPGRWLVELETHDDRMYSDATAADPTFPTYDFPPPRESQADPVTNLTLEELLPETWPCIYDVQIKATWSTSGATGQVTYEVILAEIIAADSIFTGEATIVDQNTLQAINAFGAALEGNWVRVEGFPSAENNGLWIIRTVVNNDEVTLSDSLRSDENVLEDTYSGLVDITSPNVVNATGAFAVAQEGQRIELSGFTDAANNGVFTITTKNSADEVVVFPAGLVTESAPAANANVLGATITVMVTSEEDTYSETTRNTTVTVKGLKPLTPYEVVVYAIIDGVRPSKGVSERLTTSNDHIVPDNVSGLQADTDCGLITLSWDFSAVCVSGYEIRYAPAGTGWDLAPMIARVQGPLFEFRGPAGLVGFPAEFYVKAFIGEYGRADYYSVTEAIVAATIPDCPGTGGSDPGLEDRVDAIEQCLLDEGFCRELGCLVFDGDFEVGNLDGYGWHYHTFGSLTTDPVHGGTYALQYEDRGGGNNDRGFYVRQRLPVNVIADTPSTISAWAYDAVERSYLVFAIGQYDANGEPLSIITASPAKRLSATGVWEELSHDFTAVAGARVMTIDVRCNDYTPPTVDLGLVVDDIKIVPCLTPVSNACPVLLNANFEESDFTITWWDTAHAGSPPTLENGGPAHAGNNSVRLFNSAHRLYQYATLSRLTIPLDLTVNIWLYKDDPGNPTYDIDFTWYDENMAPISSDTYTNLSVASNATWHLESIAVTGLPITAKVLRVQISANVTGIDLYVDDISITCP